MKSKIAISEVFSELITSIGDKLFYPILVAYAFIIGQEQASLLLGGVVFTEYVSYVVAPYLGQYLDRVHKRINLYVIAYAIQAVMYIMSIFYLDYYTYTLFFILLVLNLVSGILNKVATAMSMSLVLNTLDNEGDIKQYRGNIMTVRTVVLVFGQLIGSLVLGVIGVKNVAFLNSITFLIPIAIVYYFYKDYKKSELSLRKKIAQTEFTSTTSILKTIWNNAQLKMLLINVMFINFTLLPLISIFIPMKLSDLHVDASQINLNLGIILLFFGIANIIGITIVRFLKLNRLSVKLMLPLLEVAIVCALFIFSLTTNVVQLYIIAAIYGVCIGGFNIIIETFFFTLVPVENVVSYNSIMESFTLGVGVISSIIASMMLVTMPINTVLVMYSCFLIVTIILLHYPKKRM